MLAPANAPVHAAQDFRPPAGDAEARDAEDVRHAREAGGGRPKIQPGLERFRRMPESGRRTRRSPAPQ